MGKSKYTIFRTYEGRRRPILPSAEIIHEYLFNRWRADSEYGDADARLLTKFFNELKNGKYNKEKNDFGSAEKQYLMEERYYNAVKALGIDFTKGGQGQAGIAFEKEIEKLVTSSSSMGQETAFATINLGTDNFEQAKMIVAKIFEKDVNKIPEEIIKNIVPGDQFDSSSPGNFYLKVGVKRYGKIDFQAGEKAQLSFHVEGEPSDELKRIEDLLLHATFSIKSYKSDRDVHLGNTSKVKAVSAVSEYVASEAQEPNAKWAGYYYIKHPEEEVLARQDPEEVKLLYQHYGHMRSVYELTGLGLKYGNSLSSLTQVDFLLVNRANSDRINVYSTRELIQHFANSDKYMFSLGNDILVDNR